MNSILSATVLIPLIVIVLLIVLLCVGYVKAPPDMAYIISGVKKKSKVVIGKASIRIPFFERLDKLNLRLIPIDVKTSNAVPTADYININVDATVNVKISNDPEKLRLAAENFLNKNTEYIASVAREVLEGNVREIVGKMRDGFRPSEICQPCQRKCGAGSGSDGTGYHQFQCAEFR